MPISRYLVELTAEFATEQIREVIEGSYRIIYYIKSDQIDILAVLHSAQQLVPPEDLSE